MRYVARFYSSTVDLLATAGTDRKLAVWSIQNSEAAEGFEAVSLARVQLLGPPGRPPRGMACCKAVLLGQAESCLLVLAMPPGARGASRHASALHLESHPLVCATMGLHRHAHLHRQNSEAALRPHFTGCYTV